MKPKQSKKPPAAPRRRAGVKPGTRMFRQGSGLHPLDAEWLAKGFVTLGQATAIAGISRQALNKRMRLGSLVEGVDYMRHGASGPTAVVYVRRTVAERLRREGVPHAKVTRGE